MTKRVTTLCITTILLLCIVHTTNAQTINFEEQTLDRYYPIETHDYAYNGTVCVAVGPYNVILKSTDFLHWSLCNVEGEMFHFSRVFWTGNEFVALSTTADAKGGNTNVWNVHSSADGLNWTYRSSVHESSATKGHPTKCSVLNNGDLIFYDGSKPPYDFIWYMSNYNLILELNHYTDYENNILDINTKGDIPQTKGLFYNTIDFLSSSNRYSLPHYFGVETPVNFFDVSGDYGYITTVSGEMFFVTNNVRYSDSQKNQKVYSFDAFRFFNDTYKCLVQYDKTESGYILCTPVYRINSQNEGWGNWRTDTIYLYDNNLNLVGEKTFNPGGVYSVEYINGTYFAAFVNGGMRRNDPISYSYKMSKDFENWEDCENPQVAQKESIVYEGKNLKKYYGFGEYIILSDDNNKKKYLCSMKGIYRLNVSSWTKYSVKYFWEDDEYFSITDGQTLLKTHKQPLYDSLDALDKLPIIKLNDTILGFEQPPIMEKDRTLVPMQFLFEQMGADVDWDEVTKTATVKKDSKIISFQIDSHYAKVNNNEKIMDVPAKLFNDKTMIPLRFLSENLGYNVEWDEATKMVTIIPE